MSKKKPIITDARPPEYLPTEFNPKKLEDFIGPAKIVAQRIVKAAAMCVPRMVPVSILLVGPKGGGKTSLARFAMNQFGVQQCSLDEVFGSDLSVDKAREISIGMRMSRLFPGYAGYLFDEIDRCTREARDRALEFVGESRQAKGTIIVATSNMPITEIDALEKTQDARGRFSGRFQVFDVAAPTYQDAIPLVSKWLPEDKARELCIVAATGTTGGKPLLGIDTRALLKDVLSLMQA